MNEYNGYCKRAILSLYNNILVSHFLAKKNKCFSPPKIKKKASLSKKRER